MTACHEILGLISTSLDKALTPEEQARLDSHLAACPDCRVAWQDLRWTHAQIKGLEAVEPPLWLTSKIMARVRAEAAPKASFWRRFIRPIVLKPQFQVASILLLAATGFYLLRSQRSSQDLLGAWQQQPAPPRVQNRTTASDGAQVSLSATSQGARIGLQKPPNEGLNRAQTEAPRPMKPDYALSPPGNSAAGAPSTPAPAEAAKQEFSRAKPEALATAPPPPPPPPPFPAAPSAAAGTILGGAVSVAGDSAVAPSRQAKKASPASAKEEPRQKSAESADQQENQPEGKDKSEAAAWVVRMEVADAHSAAPLIERELARIGATVVARSQTNTTHGIRVRLAAERLPELLSKLAKIGKVVARPDVPSGPPSEITLSIRW